MIDCRSRCTTFEKTSVSNVHKSASVAAVLRDFTFFTSLTGLWM
jgi:hypothetical protein